MDQNRYDRSNESCALGSLQVRERVDLRLAALTDECDRSRSKGDARHGRYLNLPTTAKFCRIDVTD